MLFALPACGHGLRYQVGFAGLRRVMLAGAVATFIAGCRAVGITASGSHNEGFVVTLITREEYAIMPPASATTHLLRGQHDGCYYGCRVYH